MNYDEIFNIFESSYVDKEIRKEVILDKLSNSEDKEIINRFVTNAYIKYSIKAENINKTAEKDFEEIQIIEINISDYRAVYDIYGILLTIIPYPILAIFRYKDRVAFSVSNRILDDKKNNKGKIYTSYLIREEEIVNYLKIDITNCQTMIDVYNKWISNIEKVTVYYEKLDTIIEFIEVGFHIKSSEVLEKLESYIARDCGTYNMKPKDGWNSKLDKYSDNLPLVKKIETHILWEYLTENTFLKNRLEDFTNWNDFKENVVCSNRMNESYYSQYNSKMSDDDEVDDVYDNKTENIKRRNVNLNFKVELIKNEIKSSNNIDNRINELIEEGKEKGNITYIDLAKKIDETDDLDKVFSALEKNNIKVLEKDREAQFNEYQKQLLETIENEPTALENADYETKDNFNFMIAAAKIDVLCLLYLSDRLKNNKEFMLKAIDIDFLCMEYASDELKNDEDFCLKAIEIDVCCLEFISDDLYENKEFMLKAIEKNRLAVSYINEEQKNDEEFILRALEKSELAVGFLGVNLKNNEDFMIDLIKKDYWNARYLGEDLRNNKEFMLEIIKLNIWFILCASNELIQDESFILRAIELNSWSVNFIEPSLSNNFEFMLKAIEKNGLSIEYAGDKLEGNSEFIQRLSLILDISKYLTDDVITDKEVVLRAIENNDIWCFAFVDSELKNDKEFMLKAITKNSSCIGYASNNLLDDFEFMKEVIKINPRCVSFASRRLKNDANFMLEALKKDLWCMDYLGAELKKNKDFILQAIDATDFRCMSFDTAYYRNNKEFMLKAIEKDFRCYLYGNNEIKYNQEIISKLKETMKNSNRI